MDEYHDNEEEEDWSRPLEDGIGWRSETPHDNPGLAGTPQHQQHSTRSTGSADACMSKFGHTRTVIHIDIDCFYAQVEMIRNPDLRNKPLGVQQKYLVVTCNYVARERGVTKMMGVKQALEKCPNLVLVSGEDLTHYRQMSYRISEFLHQYTPHVERLGMDENFLDVSHLVQQRLEESDKSCLEIKGHVYADVEDDRVTGGQQMTCGCGCHGRLVIGSHLAADIRDALHRELGITCCAGISYNKLLSKLVAGKHKPNQQTTLFSEQTSNFIAAVGQVGRIPGIGWTTSKKLATLGIVSIEDLQQFDLSDLKQELGTKQAVVIRELSFGVDDSPVVTFGKPQTLSDEDSFKKCTTVNDARLKVRELLCSLMKRLFDDGRIPQTIRLTIRKMTPTDQKWTSRESRQCPIPGHIFSSLSKERLEKTVEQLEEITMTLFSKLVNPKEPFHLTLMNVGFCSLVEKAKNSINTFFSVQSPGDGTKVSNSSRVIPGASEMVSPTLKKGKRSQGIQNWILKSPGNISKPQIVEELSTGTSELSPRLEESSLSSQSRPKEAKSSQDGLGKHDCQDEMTITEHEINLRSKKKQCFAYQKERDFDSPLSIKHGQETRNFDVIVEDGQGTMERCRDPRSLSVGKRKRNEDQGVEDGVSKKRKCACMDGGGTMCIVSSSEQTSRTAESRTPEGQMSEKLRWIPEGLDRDVFVQLPIDIQREILQQAKSTDNLNSGQFKNMSGSDNFVTRTDVKSGVPKGTTVNEKFCDRIRHLTDSAESDTASVSPDVPVYVNDIKLLSPCNQPSASGTGLFGSISTSSRVVCDSEQQIAKRSESEKSQQKPKEEEKHSVISESPSSQDRLTGESRLPPHIDKDVFASLPSDIQKEYTMQWSQTRKSPKQSGKSPRQDGKSPGFQQKQPATASIMQFFPSKNKK